jgi:hypothetical protein
VKHEDHRADNLFLRLFSYTPRGESQIRQPLEDFCTEALAWCLRNCSQFRKPFLAKIIEKPADLEVAIATQSTYESEENDSGDPSDCGRFDLVIQFRENKVLAIVETKTYSSFGPDQLERYRQELRRQASDLQFRGILVTLTDGSERSPGADRHLTWAEVYRFLILAGTNADGAGFPENLCLQFAEFLKEKGLGPLNIRKIVGQPIEHWITGLKFRQELETILKALQNDSELKKEIGRRKIIFEEAAGGLVWLGIHGITSDFWIGFRFAENEVFMHVQKAVAQNREDEFRKAEGITHAEFANGKTYIEIERKLGAADGNAEEIKNWLLEHGNRILQIGRS